MVTSATPPTSGPSDFKLIKDGFNQFVVKPLNAFGLGGFVFDVEGDSTINLTAEITDHYTENNKAVQDHIAIAPARVTLKNYVGELVHRLDDKTETTLQKAVQKLTILDAYLPEIADSVQQVLDGVNGGLSIDTIDDIFPDLATNVLDLWAFTKNLNPGASRQQQAYLYFKTLQEQKLLVSVQTPFQFFTNMAIETIVAVQPETSAYISDFSITLKQIRFASSAVTPVNLGDFQGRAGIQQAGIIDKGPTPATEISSSLFDTFFGVER